MLITAHDLMRVRKSTYAGTIRISVSQDFTGYLSDLEALED